MSRQPLKQAPPAPETVTEAQVLAFLEAWPDFLTRHPALVAGLRLPWPGGKGSISLVEYQMRLLRERNARLERQLAELIAAGHANDRLQQQMQRLILALVGAAGAEEALALLHRHLRADFAAERVVLLLTGDLAADLDSGLARPMRWDETSRGIFLSLLKSGHPLCGRLTAAQSRFLYGDEAETVRSSALIPLGTEARHGLLAIGSHSPEHFTPDMGTLFLAQLGEVVAAILDRSAGSGRPATGD